ncbi:hypothetical protein SAMN05421820_116138, partial [Pedobacter steynii]
MFAGVLFTGKPKIGINIYSIAFGINAKSCGASIKNIALYFYIVSIYAISCRVLA